MHRERGEVLPAHCNVPVPGRGCVDPAVQAQLAPLSSVDEDRPLLRNKERRLSPSRFASWSGGAATREELFPQQRISKFRAAFETCSMTFKVWFRARRWSAPLWLTRCRGGLLRGEGFSFLESERLKQCSHFFLEAQEREMQQGELGFSTKQSLWFSYPSKGNFVNCVQILEASSVDSCTLDHTRLFRSVN